VALDIASINGCRLVVISAHLPHEKRDPECFCSELDAIDVFLDTHRKKGGCKFVLAADFNSELPEYGSGGYPTVGNLGVGNKLTDRSMCILEILVRYNMTAINTSPGHSFAEVGGFCAHQDRDSAWTWSRKNRWGGPTPASSTTSAPVLTVCSP
jgi:hypothetical protein